jgi:hypothetical protein
LSLTRDPARICTKKDRRAVLGTHDYRSVKRHWTRFKKGYLAARFSIVATRAG